MIALRAASSDNVDLVCVPCFFAPAHIVADDKMRIIGEVLPPQRVV